MNEITESTKITKEMKDDYAKLNDIIHQHNPIVDEWKACVIRMHETGLYKVKYKKFDDYIRENLPIGKTTAYKIIGKIGKKSSPANKTSDSEPKTEPN